MEPVRGVILYDSVCILCSRWTRFVVARDPGAIFRFVPIQSGKGRAMALALDIDPDDPDTFALVLDGAALKRSAAIIAIVEQLVGWKWCRCLRYLPRTILDWLYDRIAKNRYSLFGKAQTCIVPDVKIRSRFDDLDSAMARDTNGRH